MNRQEKLYRNTIKKPLEVKFSPNKFNLRTKSPNLLKHVPSVHFSNRKLYTNFKAVSTTKPIQNNERINDEEKHNLRHTSSPFNRDKDELGSGFS